jgi:large subunit ribosomal protein L3
MPKAYSSRKGSLAFRPRKRSETLNGRVRNWPDVSKPCLLGFAGYKAGMQHIIYNETDKNSPRKGKDVSVPTTIIEVPPILVYAARVYKKTKVGKKLLGDYYVNDEKILKKAKVKDVLTIDKINEVVKDIIEVRVLALTSPFLTGIGKKKPEVLELGVGGEDIQKKIDYVKSILGKEISAEEVFEKGSYIDVIAVTKGKGWQGVIKKFGVSIQRRKATGKRRHVGNLGAWTPSVVEYTSLQAGQMGYHKRTILNNLIVDMGDSSSLKQEGGLLHYGEVRNKFILIKGSVPGPKKRLIKLRRALRKTDNKKEMNVSYMSKAM